MSFISLSNFVRGNLVWNVFRKPYLYKNATKDERICFCCVDSHCTDISFHLKQKEYFSLTYKIVGKGNVENEGNFLRAQFSSQFSSDVDTQCVSPDCVSVNLIPKHSPLIRPSSVLFSDILNRDMIDHWLFSDKCLQHTSPRLTIEHIITRAR